MAIYIIRLISISRKRQTGKKCVNRTLFCPHSSQCVRRWMEASALLRQIQPGLGLKIKSLWVCLEALAKSPGGKPRQGVL